MLSGIKSMPTLLRFEDDGKTLLAGGTDDGVHSWDVETGKLRHGDPKVKGWIAMSPDGTMLVSYPGYSATGPVDFCDRKSGKSLGKISGADGSAHSVAVAPDNRSIATCGDDGLLRRWKIPSGEEINRPVGHQHHITGVGFTRDGRTVISSSEDGTVRFWDTSTGRESKRLSARDEHFQALAVSSNGKTLALAGNGFARRWFSALGEDRQTTNLHFWDLEGGKEIRSYYRVGSAPAELRFASDDRASPRAGFDRGGNHRCENRQTQQPDSECGAGIQRR